MKKNWKLQCLLCEHSRKETDRAIVVCVKELERHLIFYGSDLFTGFITCDKFDPMRDPYGKDIK